MTHSGPIARAAGKGSASGRDQARQDWRWLAFPYRDDARYQPPVLSNVNGLAMSHARQHIARVVAQVPETDCVPIRCRHGMECITILWLHTRRQVHDGHNARHVGAASQDQLSALIGPAGPLARTTPIGQDTPVPWSGQ